MRCRTTPKRRAAAGTSGRWRSAYRFAFLAFPFVLAFFFFLLFLGLVFAVLAFFDLPALGAFVGISGAGAGTPASGSVLVSPLEGAPAGPGVAFGMGDAVFLTGAAGTSAGVASGPMSRSFNTLLLRDIWGGSILPPTSVAGRRRAPDGRVCPPLRERHRHPIGPLTGRNQHIWNNTEDTAHL